MAHETNTPHSKTPPTEDPYYGLAQLPGARVSEIDSGQFGKLDIEVVPVDAHKAERGLERLATALMADVELGDIEIDTTTDIGGSYTYERVATPHGVVGAVRHQVQGSGQRPKLAHITVRRQ